MALTIGDLVGYIRADSSDFQRNLARSQLRMEGFRVDVNGRLRDIRGRFVDEAHVMGRALADGFSDAERSGTRIVTVYSSVADAQSRTMRARLARLQAGSRRFGNEVRRAFTRAREAWDRLNFDRLGRVAAGFGAVAGSVGKVAAQLGAAVPLAAGLAATLANIAPAAGLAATGIVAVVLASKALKIGMVGVGDAVKAAMDPSNPEAFNEALKKLSPSAQAFAKQVRALQPEFKRLQQGVQERLFKGFDNTLKGLAATTLPTVRKGLFGASDALNRMGKNVAVAANNLSTSGALGAAVSGATAGLKNLSRAPGQVVLGLGQIAAAAAPAFKSLTGAAAGAMDRLSARLSSAFESGAMQQAIENAIDLIGQFVDVAKNIGSIFSSVFSAAQVSGGGLVGVLKDITSSLADAFASGPVQSGLKAIFQTMSTLGKTVGPLLGEALKGIAPVFTALGPPVQTLIKALGAALQPVIRALGPVLEAAARAVGALVTAAAPLLPVVGELVAALLPAVTPLFDALATVFTALAPVVKQVADTLSATLKPILAGLAPIIEPLAALLADQLVFALQIFGDLITALSPSLITLGEALGEMMVALGPLIEAWGELSRELLTALMPILTPLIGLIGKLAAYLAGDLARSITEVVVPAIKSITALLRGDFAGAQAYAREAVRGFVDNAIRRFTELPMKAAMALTRLSIELRLKANAAGLELVRKLTEKRDEAVRRIRELPGRAAAALGGLGGRLYSAGASLVQGFINGINAKIGEVRATLNNLTSMLPDWKGPAERDARILTPAGRSVIQGFQAGIAAQVPSLQRQLQGITGSMPGMAMGPLSGGGLAGAGSARPIVIELRGPGLKDVIREVVQVDGRGDVQVAFGQR